MLLHAQTLEQAISIAEMFQLVKSCASARTTDDYSNICETNLAIPRQEVIANWWLSCERILRQVNIHLETTMHTSILLLRLNNLPVFWMNIASWLLWLSPWCFQCWKPSIGVLCLLCTWTALGHSSTYFSLPTGAILCIAKANLYVKFQPVGVSQWWYKLGCLNATIFILECVKMTIQQHWL